jgi:hypothetical protein
MRRKTVSAVVGFRESPWQNFGKVNNKGFDGNITVKQRINDLTLNFRGNVTYAKNKVVEYDELSPQYDYQRYTGQSLGKPMLYIADGLYTNNDFVITDEPSNGSKIYTLKEGSPKPSSGVRPGDIKYLDLNGDGKIDSYDVTYNNNLYSEIPEMVYGFGLNADYKGFYAGVFFQGVANASINVNSVTPFRKGQTTSAREAALDHWSSRNPDNQNVLSPRLHTEEFQHNIYNSTWWYKSANFIRLKNVELGYVLDAKKMKKMALRNARIYLQGNNLAVWDKIKMWDPELGSAGGGVKYPLSMTWTVGLELGF